MRVLFWAKIKFARNQLLETLSQLPIELTVAHSLEDVLHGISSADMFVSTDCAPEQAALIAPALANSPVRWFQFLSAGRERLLAAGLPKELVLFGPGDTYAGAVSEHAIALAMALYRGLPHSMDTDVNTDWEAGKLVQRRSMGDETAVVIGMGAIGKELARKAKALGMEVLGVTRNPTSDPNCADVVGLDDLAAVLPRAGSVFLTIALGPETKHLMNREAFALMPQGAFLVNVARGGLVDQEALCAALRSGQIGGAGLDVTEPEPLPVGDDLWSIPNVIITPHIAAFGSTKAQQRLAANVAKNITSVMA